MSTRSSCASWFRSTAASSVEAVQTLDAVIGADPRTDWAYNELVQIFMTHGRLRTPRKSRARRCASIPHSAHGHNLFGLVLSEMNDLPPGNGTSAVPWSWPVRTRPIC